jgi:hypothetical protein
MYLLYLKMFFYFFSKFRITSNKFFFYFRKQNSLFSFNKTKIIECDFKPKKSQKILKKK